LHVDLTANVKTRVIEEVRRFWSANPRFKALSVRGEYAEKERSQESIVIRTSGGNRADQDPDNYRGVINSYVLMARFRDHPGVFLDWIREDSRAIQKNGGVFPSPPGVYYIQLTDDRHFLVDSLLDQFAEKLTQLDPTSYRTARSFVKGSLRVHEMPNQYLLFEGIDYTVELDTQDKPTGRIVLSESVPSGRWLQASYRYPGEVLGPSDESPQGFEVHPDLANNHAIPGVVLAFNDQLQAGDILTVIVQPYRRPAYLEYGGRWQINLEGEILARDSHTRSRLLDRTVGFLWGVARPYLATEEYELTDVQNTGESEEIYDEGGEDYLFTGTFSATVEVEWSVHVPLVLAISMVDFYSFEEIKYMAGISNGDLADLSTTAKTLSHIKLVACV